VTSKLTYLFCSGGYDSVFRLCQLVLVEKKETQPILVSQKIDVRSSATRRMERQVLNHICQQIRDTYPKAKKLLKRPIIIDKRVQITNDPELMRVAAEIGYGNRGSKRNPKEKIGTQYVHLARVAKHFPKPPIEIGIEVGGRAERFFKNDLVDVGKPTCRLKPISQLTDPKMDIFRNFRFPIFHLTKEEMKKYAETHEFTNILDMTVSCWYPKNNRACGRCPMCRRRVATQKIWQKLSPAPKNESRGIQRNKARRRLKKKR